jgi:hypothetical protein
VTPVPLDLPLRPSEAAELANLIFDQAERKPLTDELRTRLAGRAAVLKLESIRPYFGSLERDPVHPSAYYLAVDGIEGSPQLLYLALSTAPTSSIFHKPLLIGRMRRDNGPEFVINASPFGPADCGNIELFATKIESAFQPRQQGSRAEVVLPADCAAAFDTFRAIYKRTGKNVAALAGDYHAGLWAAIRAGWRQGYAGVCEGPVVPLPYSRFAVDGSSLPEAAQLHEQIRQARAALKLPAGFEFEVMLPECDAAGLETSLEWLRTSGHAAQFAAPERISGDLAEAAAAARRQQVTLSFRYRGEDSAAIQDAAKATLGRISFRVRDAEEAAFVAGELV